MKIKLFISALLFACSLQLLAQTQNFSNSIVGTWKLVSMTGTDADGTPINPDLSKASQYKIITPTHWMYVNYDPQTQEGSGDGGTYVLKGNKYTEALTDGLKTDFTVKVEGDKYYQDGAIILPDGKKVVLHEVYQRIEEPTNLNKEIVGTWDLLSSYHVKEGKKEPIADLTELLIFTPTYYMYVSKKANKFDAARVGTYKKEGNKVVPTPILGSSNLSNKDKVEVILSVKGDQLTSNGTVIKGDDGTKGEWLSVYQKAGAKPKIAKTTSTK